MGPEGGNVPGTERKKIHRQILQGIPLNTNSHSHSISRSTRVRRIFSVTRPISTIRHLVTSIRRLKFCKKDK